MIIDLSIIIPTYKEEKRIGKTLEELADYLKNIKEEIEVIIIDADSPDKTTKIARNYADLFKHFRIINDGPKEGKGKQVRDGVFEAKGKYIMFMDADLATPLKYLKKVFYDMHKKKSVSICVRNLQKTHKGLRKFISGFGNFLVQILLLPGIKDSQCGFKSFEANAARDIFSRQTIIGWGFDMEILAIARKLGYSIDMINVEDWKDVEKGSKISGNFALKVALTTFGDLLTIKKNLILGKYKTPIFTYQSTNK
ncbi:MAG: glycosyltransferase [bacterium]|nr:glycosyltransferase [bacterium]